MTLIKGESPNKIENPFAHLPKALAEFEKVPSAVQRMFLPHLNFIRENHDYLKDIREPRAIDGFIHNVRKQERGGEEVFEFYHEEGNKRITLELRTDKGYNRVQVVNVVSGSYNSEGERVERIQTEFKMRRGVNMAQEVEPVPGFSDEHAFQRLILNDLAVKIARLTLTTWGEDQEILTIESNRQTVKTPYGTLVLPSSDEFIQEAIQKILRFEPVRLLE